VVPPEDPEAWAFHGVRYSLYRDLVMLIGVAGIYGLRRYRAIKAADITLIMDRLFKKKRRRDDGGH